MIILKPIKPILNWQLCCLEAPSLSELHIDTLDICNLAEEEFACVVEVLNAASETCRDVSVDDNGQMTRLLWPVDIISMTKGLLESSSAHCFHCRTISKELICAISYDMGQCIMQPLVGVDNEEAVVYRLVSAIAMRRDNCAVVAYAVGQLTSSTVHEPDMSIAIRGFAMSQDARESVIDSITRCMLIG